MNFTRKLIFIFLACFVKALSGAQASSFLNLKLYFPEKDKRTKIKVKPNTTVKALMSYVKNHFDINSDEQLLRYNNDDLSNRFAHLSTYGIQNGDNIYIFKMPKPLNQSLSDLDYILGFIQSNGSRYRLYVNPNSTVGELKALINKQEVMTYAIPVNLFLEGETMVLNDNIKLREAGIHDGSLIYVYPQKHSLH